MGAVLPGFHPFRPGNTACGAGHKAPDLCGKRARPSGTARARPAGQQVFRVRPGDTEIRPQGRGRRQGTLRPHRFLRPWRGEAFPSLKDEPAAEARTGPKQTLGPKHRQPERIEYAQRNYFLELFHFVWFLFTLGIFFRVANK